MIKSLGTYEFPSRSRQELYGDDILVNVLRRDSMFFCSAAMFRAPKAMKWSDFVENMVMPYVTSDPDFDAGKEITWQLVDEDFTPDPEKSLAENGVQHKHTISLIGA
ncbi:MAG: phenol hydroxylase [Propionibacterium sp.]|nr:phenol hydroxylase [Propionibacterium sp.]